MKPLVCGLGSLSAALLSGSVAFRDSLCSCCILSSACYRANSFGRCWICFCLSSVPRSMGLWSRVATAMQTVTARRRAKMKKSRGGRKTIRLFDGRSKCAQLMEHCSPAKPAVLWPPGEMSLSWLFPEKGTVVGHS